jgi:hypothetical protein
MVQDESIFVYDYLIKRKKWISAGKRPIVTVTVTGSRKRTIVFGCLSLDSNKQLFKQYDKFNSNTFVDYLKHVQKRFGKSSCLLIEQHHIVPRLQKDSLILIRISSDWNIFLLVLQSLTQ